MPSRCQPWWQKSPSRRAIAEVLTAEEDRALATTPTEDLLALAMLQPDRVRDAPAT